MNDLQKSLKILRVAKKSKRTACTEGQRGERPHEVLSTQKEPHEAAALVFQERDLVPSCQALDRPA